MANAPQYLLVGLDAKVDWKDGRIRYRPPGGDALLIFDVGTDPRHPKEVVRLPLANSVFGPPTNLAVTPDQQLALLADSMVWQSCSSGWQPQPGRHLHVIDLSSPTPQLTKTLDIGLQPSGLAINRQGTLALVANRAGCSVSVLRIDGNQVFNEGELELGTPAAAVSFSASGRQAYVAKMDQHRLGVLHIDGARVSHDPAEDIVTGQVPFNVAVTPDGVLGLTVDMGHPNASDGHVDTVSVIDLSQQPPRVINRVTVGDGPEGLAMSPDGRHAAVAIVQGCNEPAQAWFHHPLGSIALLTIDGHQVNCVQHIDAGALPEGLAFSPDGRFLYVGNFLDGELQVFAVDASRLTDTGHRIPLGGRPASMRMQSF